MHASLPSAEYDRRLAEIRDALSASEADGGVWFDATSIEYLVGFHHVSTERPVALVVTDETVAATVPRLEVERIRANEFVETVTDYYDYPQGEPIRTLAGMLDELGVERVAADGDGAPGVMGYEGPALSTFLPLERQSWVTRARERKSAAEHELIRTSGHWAVEAHRELAARVSVGDHPVVVSGEASTAASERMLSTLGDAYVSRTRGRSPAFVGMVSGEQTALPHGHAPNEPLREGDVVITGGTADVCGYYAELERTLFVGDPSPEDRHYFELVSEAQRLAVDALEPGVETSYVDERVEAYFDEQGVTSLSRHHTGHNVGLVIHEPPYLDVGSDDVVEPGHVYAVEPGLYTDDAGYRQSDTFLVHEDGVEHVTDYPNDLESSVVR